MKCLALTTCADDEYESKAPTENTNRECKPLPICAPNQYMIINDDNTRQCKDFTECSENEYISAVGTKDKDQVCDDLTVCQDNQVEKTPPTEKSDRVCRLTSCPDGSVVGPTGVWVDENGNCKDIDKCPAGRGVDTISTSTSNTVCRDCVNGEFSANDSAEEMCTSHSVCEAGQQGQGGTIVTDVICNPCPSEHYKTGSGLGNCLPWTTCGPTYYVSDVGTAISNRVCKEKTICKKDNNEGLVSEAMDATSSSLGVDRVCQTCPAGSKVTEDNQKCIDQLEIKSSWSWKIDGTDLIFFRPDVNDRYIRFKSRNGEIEVFGKNTADRRGTYKNLSLPKMSTDNILKSTLQIPENQKSTFGDWKWYQSSETARDIFLCREKITPINAKTRYFRFWSDGLGEVDNNSKYIDMWVANCMIGSQWETGKTCGNAQKYDAGYYDKNNIWQATSIDMTNWKEVNFEHINFHPWKWHADGDALFLTNTTTNKNIRFIINSGTNTSNSIAANGCWLAQRWEPGNCGFDDKINEWKVWDALGYLGWRVKAYDDP